MDGYIGEIRIFAGGYAPYRWAICDGSTLMINDYQALYSLIGNTYGGTPGTTFKLPDFRGRMLIGQGAGAGLTERHIGEKGGTKEVKLKAENLPVHKHMVQTDTQGISTNTPSSDTFLGKMTTPDGEVVGYLPQSATTPPKVSLDSRTIGYGGVGSPHENVMPSLAINYIICIENSTYPSR